MPATREPRSILTRRLLCKTSAISPLAIRWARPSTIAVLPTPGSPIKIGLFFVLLASIWVKRSISSSLPITGSSLPSRASCVKSRECSSRVGVEEVSCFFSKLVKVLFCFSSLNSFSCSEIVFKTKARIRSSVILKFCKMRAPTPSCSAARPSKRCSVFIKTLFKICASSKERSKTLFDLAVKGISLGIETLSPLPTSCSIALIIFGASRPRLYKIA